MPNDPDVRRATWGIIVTILAAAIIGWGSWITTYAMAHRERIVALEQCTTYQKENLIEIKRMLYDIQDDVKTLRERGKR